MAARKKTSPKKSSPAKPKRASRKTAARKATAKTKAAARKKAPAAAKKARRALSPAEALARKIVKMTVDPASLELAELYAPECSSREPTGEPLTGLAALEEKFQGFEAMVTAQSWTALSVLTHGNTICIEWSADLDLADGRKVTLEEVAIHEVKAGKIISERFYYDPAILAPPPPEKPEPVPGPPPVMPEIDDGPPPIDPIDL